MSENVIVVENLSKRYLIGHRFASRDKWSTLRDVAHRGIANFVRKAADFAKGRQVVQGDEIEEFWALQDISFEIKQGEVLGIIGRNGAGKSTLLKILSRITEPTTGRALLRGRVASLLEVGTGFHPELTGRENIFLYGAILGMTQREIHRRFDEIVAFAEVERFLDTPVKRYSSGMYVRLAFAVAAHLEAELLIVDEVLAVGDQRFQEKCMSKMSEVGNEGRTILFVSHSLPSIQRLCKRVIVLEKGKVLMDAPAMEAVAEYLSGNQTSIYFATPSRSTPTISRAAVEEREQSLVLTVDFQSPFPLSPPVLGFVIYDPTGNVVFGTNGRLQPPSVAMPPTRSGCIEAVIPANHLRANRYLISLWLGDAYSDYCELPHVLQVEVTGIRVDHQAQYIGNMILPVQWSLRESSSTEGAAISAD